jgi:replicative DNA helicase
MERCLLMSMICNQDALLSCAHLNPEVFFVPANQIIFSILCNLASHDTPLAFPLVKLELSKANQLEEIGGVGYLNDMYDNSAFLPSSADWRRYRELVCGDHRRRVTIVGCQELIGQMYDRGLEADQSIAEIVEATLTKLSLNAAKPEKSFRDKVTETLQEIERRGSNEGLSGVMFGLPSLDNELGGIRPGNHCVIASRTSGGKSALAAQAALETARRGQAVAIFSYEMSSNEVIERMLAFEGDISMRAIRFGRFSKPELDSLHQSAETLSSYPIYIDEDFSADVDRITNRVRQLKLRVDLGLVVVDYLQLVPARILSRNSTREREVADISRKIKLLALELRVPTIALSQLNLEGRTRESLSIPQDANIVLRIEEKDDCPPPAPGMPRDVEIVVDKDRNGRRDHRVPVQFFAEYMRFKEPPRYGCH